MNSSAEMKLMFEKGVELYNRREFFLCHEILEEVWKKQSGPEKELSQGLIQIAVAYYHALRGNRPGAVKLLGKGLVRLRASLHCAEGLSLARFADDVETDLRSLIEGLDVSEIKMARIEPTE